jgi:hypothetical protein
MKLVLENKICNETETVVRIAFGIWEKILYGIETGI